MEVVEVQAFKDWMEENPIRKYRKANGLSVHLFAAMAGVSEYTVQRWERGTTPNDENMKKLEVLIPGIVDKWAEWEKSKPRI